MKKSLFLLFTLLTFWLFKAQTVYNKSYHDINEKANPFLVNLHGYFYFTNTVYSPHTVYSVIYKHSGTGILKFRTGVIVGMVEQMFGTKDEKLLITGTLNYCDVIPENQENYIQKIDTNGQIIFTSFYSMDSTGIPKSCLQYSDSSYFSFTDSLLIKHTKNGQFLSKTNLGLKNISAAIVLLNNNMLISATQASNTVLAEISSSGNIIASSPFPTLLNKMRFYNGQKIVAKGIDGNFYKISPNRVLLASNSNSANTFISDFTCSGDSIYCILSDNIGLQKYAIMDTSFNSLQNSSTSTHSVIQNAIEINSSNILILSTGLASKNYMGSASEHYFCSISSLNKNGSNNFNPDLQLCDVYADSTYSKYSTSYLRTKIKVKNNGNSIIYSFKLNHFERPAVDCGTYFYQESFSNLAIQPGDSVILTAKQFASNFYNNVTGLITYTTNYCFYVSIPNGETDKLPENNEICKTFSFVTTSINETKKSEHSISIAPNPFNNGLKIETDRILKKISIYNAFGQLIKSVEANSLQIIMDTSELDNGIYFLHIETEKGTIIKKVLKH